ncbi:MAG: gliding motility-associated ABC transporter ATP-binding subunit GldA [Bacteroidota bacterium]
MSIEVKNICKNYGKQKALDQVSFSLKQGEIVGFLGPNGAGKSTMMKILSCFIPPSSGDASVCGFDVLEQSLEVKKKIGYLPENNPLYLDMYVSEYLTFIGNLHQVGKTLDKRVKEMIELTGLGPEQHKKLGTLSKGYRQRTGLAQVLLHDPEVLILDEPTSGLDPNQLVGIRNLILEVGKAKTVLLSTHIMQEVEAICDRVIIIDQGHLVADDKTSVLASLSSGKQLITVEFSETIDKSLFSELSQAHAIEKINANTWKISSKSEIDLRPLVFQFAVNNNLTVISLQKETQRLEDVFQKLTQKS